MLGVEVERAMLRELGLTHRLLNQNHFKGVLCPVQLSLSDTIGLLGRYSSEHSSIELSRALIASQPWGVVVEVLKHEMAHQYVHEVLREQE